jgi:hypothetical protein
MKTAAVLAAVIVMTLLPAHAQQGAEYMPTKAGKYTYMESVEVEGATAAELFDRAGMWAAATYGTAPGVTRSSDPSAGRLVLNGNVNILWLQGTKVDVRHTVTIEVRDGGYDYRIDNIVADFGNARKPMEEQFAGRKSVKKRTHKWIDDQIGRLKAQMSSSTPLAEPKAAPAGTK